MYRARKSTQARKPGTQTPIDRLFKKPSVPLQTLSTKNQLHIHVSLSCYIHNYRRQNHPSIKFTFITKDKIKINLTKMELHFQMIAGTVNNTIMNLVVFVQIMTLYSKLAPLILSLVYIEYLYRRKL